MAEEKEKKSTAASGAGKKEAAKKRPADTGEKKAKKTAVRAKKDTPEGGKKGEPVKKGGKETVKKAAQKAGAKAEKGSAGTDAAASRKAGKGVEKTKSVKKPEKKAPEGRVYPRVREKYLKEVIPAMIKQFAYENVMEVPEISKVTLNIGMGSALQNKKLLDAAAEDMTIIAGQRAVITNAKRSVSNFKLRTGNPIGCKVTLRRERMYEFLDRFVTIAIPRIRDFRGISEKSFDGFGNFNIGIKEQIIFPEIDYDKVESIHGMDISIVTTAKTDEEAKALLSLIGMPFAETEPLGVAATV